MKNVFFIPKFCFMLITCLCFNDCKKNNIHVNIILYNKPSSVIQSYIQGRWELKYGKGGIAANYIQYYHNNFWQFKKDTIEILDNENIITDTTIKWIYDLGTFTNGDSTYIMNFHDKLGFIYDYVVDHISNDTLVLHQDASDAVFFHFIKSN